MTIIQTDRQNSTKKDILQYLLKLGQATAQDIAEELNISPQATRRHLKDLEGEDLIEHQQIQVKIGRPQNVYHLSRLGREMFPQGYNEFAVSFLDTLKETIGEKQVNEILEKQSERKTQQYKKFLSRGSLEERMNLLAELRRDEGYMAELYHLKDDGEGKKFFLAEHNCAISDVAESYPSVCHNELAMFAEILSDCTVERTDWINNGEHRCGYLIQSK